MKLIDAKRKIQKFSIKVSSLIGTPNFWLEFSSNFMNVEKNDDLFVCVMCSCKNLRRNN